ncbi:hypothetical protein BO78DRAFT_384542 [Aspergillus sclerotiicarbonarius CBS 121057]|uniref:HNH nuclease domain-containing protein n=1 Tax=Aspergillus sclerotiicarbonarius (strain CBS 121057 / IBT 28362) TaxID=1448318 RepID=A0A319F1R6_ASPSB|nr:hypothetical protein BO78DRAFT_384542 [Aspergillus sclerotiicarbonarius CBS 121057]
MGPRYAPVHLQRGCVLWLRGSQWFLPAKAIEHPLPNVKGDFDLICLDPWAHRLHRKGYFALEPVRTRPEGKWMVLGMWWLKPNNSSRVVRLTNIPDLPENVELAEYDFRTQKPIRSGQEITLQTPDPVNLPLPDVRILELQSILNRVVAISGAADYDEQDEDCDRESEQSQSSSEYERFYFS